MTPLLPILEEMESKDVTLYQDQIQQIYPVLPLLSQRNLSSKTSRSQASAGSYRVCNLSQSSVALRSSALARSEFVMI